MKMLTDKVNEDMNKKTPNGAIIHVYNSVNDLIADPELKDGDVARTLGYFSPNDSGGALYQIKADNKTVDGGSVITIGVNGLQAHLMHQESINYKMFGAVCDGVNDDGVQMKRAHQYANSVKIPVINLSGDFYVKSSRQISVQTNLTLGHTKIHIDESNNRYNEVYSVSSAFDSAFNLDTSLHTAVLPKLKKYTQPLVAELKAYKNHFIRVVDSTKKVGKRVGVDASSGWDMEDFFYVDEHGRFIGEVTWDWDHISYIEARKVDQNYLIIDGGTFLLSGNWTDNVNRNYRILGFNVTRSRTIIRNQFVGLEVGATDNNKNPSSGFYWFSSVYDILLENCKLFPREKDRPGTNDVPQGTYGIGGSRVLRPVFRNLTAEGSEIHWGVQGTNLFKDFIVENCKLNRIDVHFHAWNILVRDSQIGEKGFSVTGGGTLRVDNTRCTNYTFVNFRSDYGAKWDGEIIIKDCTLDVNAISDCSILNFSPYDGDYGYKIVFGTLIFIDNFMFDFSTVGETSTGNGYMFRLPSFGKFSINSTERIEFPTEIEIKNVRKRGRKAGLKLFNLKRPYDYYVPKAGGVIAPGEIDTNVRIVLDHIELTNLQSRSQDSNNTHLWMDVNGDEMSKYMDAYGIYPKIVIRNCKHLHLQPKTSYADILLENCEVSAIDAYENGEGQSRIRFVNCELKPDNGDDGKAPFFLGGNVVEFVNTTFHPVKYLGVIVWNATFGNQTYTAGNGINLALFRVMGTHVNTRLSKAIVDQAASRGTPISLEYYRALASHSEKEIGDYLPGRSLSVEVLPTADASQRGRIVIVTGGTGVADVIYVCVKTSSDSYIWKQVTLT
ncbi:hypothetical protein [Brevibacillus sp. SYSU BS000544]|uniref:hypothetical protein n=1 Tax=Brevibacillus sp. SYSU BS000544 TaxID=3416443 RepID=UPI003CE5AE13